MLTAFFNSLGKAILGYLLKKIWAIADNAIKDAIAKSHWEEHVKNVLSEYEKVIEEAKVKASDGLTEEEKNEIREKKTALEELLINGSVD